MNEETKPSKFLIADDHGLIRQGVAFMIEDLNENYEVVFASNISKIFEMLENHDLDIAIFDVHFQDGNILEILSKVKQNHPHIKILIYTGLDEEANALIYLNAGADGFLSKISNEEVVKDALRNMIEFGKYISPLTQSLLLESLKNPNTRNPISRLTNREMEIAQLYAKGMGNLEIANQLDVKQNTVSTIKKRIFEKLGIDNIVELISILNPQH